MASSSALLASKVVVKESPPAIRNIPGVATAVAAVVGVTERGPVGVPQFHTDFEEWTKTYGSYTADSMLPNAVEGFFLNGGLALWTVRTCHYTDVTDGATFTAAEGTFNLQDRGGAASAAIYNSADGPFDLEPGEILAVDFGSTATSVTVTATPATQTTAAETFVLTNNMTILYKVRMPGSTTLTETRTITFVTADFVAIGAATALEVAAVISRAVNTGIGARVSAGTVVIESDKRGSGARLELVSGTALTALGLTVSTASGTGNVSDVDYVTSTEVAAFMTGAGLTNGTVTAVGLKVRLTSTATGGGASATVRNTTTALGIFADTPPHTENGSAAGVSDTLSVTASSPGTWIQAISLVVESPSSGDADRFNLRVLKDGNTKETWADLSMDASDSRYAVDYVNARSIYVVLADLASAATPPANLPVEGTFNAWAGDDDGLTSLADVDFIGSDAGDTGLYALDEIDPITLIAVPGRATSAVHNALISYCEIVRGKSCFSVFDLPSGRTAQQAKTYVESTAALKNLSEFAAAYWPWGLVVNPSEAIFGTGETITVPPSGHLMGLYSRVDASGPGGVYLPPAGTENGRIFGFVGLDTNEAKDERKRDVVYPALINPITQRKGGPIFVDGHRTLKEDGNWPGIAERRGVIYIEQSLVEGLQVVKHRNNDDRLRNEVAAICTAFLLKQFAVSAFRGKTPEESFEVDCSDALNPEEVILAGQLNCRIALASQKAVDWVVLDVTQDTRKIQERVLRAVGN